MAYLFFLLIFLVSCGGMTQEVPATYTSLNESAPVYPDYRDVTIPCNIAPLNVMVNDAGEAFAGLITSSSGMKVVAQCEANKLFFDAAEWRSLLDASKGETL